MEEPHAPTIGVENEMNTKMSHDEEMSNNVNARVRDRRVPTWEDS